MATNIDNMKSQMRKGMLEFCVLLLLSRNDAYVSEIISRMKEAHLIVVEGTLYPLMTRLKNDGLLNYRWEESPSGPPRKYYSITPMGIHFLNELHQSWKDISKSVNHLIYGSDADLTTDPDQETGPGSATTDTNQPTDSISTSDSTTDSTRNI